MNLDNNETIKVRNECQELVEIIIEHKNCIKRPFSELERKNWQNYLCAPEPVASNTVRSWPTEIPRESSSYYSVAYQTKGGGGQDQSKGNVQ